MNKAKSCFKEEDVFISLEQKTGYHKYHREGKYNSMRTQWGGLTVSKSIK